MILEELESKLQDLLVGNAISTPIYKEPEIVLSVYIDGHLLRVITENKKFSLGLYFKDIYDIEITKNNKIVIHGTYMFTNKSFHYELPYIITNLRNNFSILTKKLRRL